MGNPDRYYKMILQKFASILFQNEPNNEVKANELYKENKTEILETEILKCKSAIMEKMFYYEAGIAVTQIYKDVYQNEGCDGLNACFGGINEFEAFIGIDDEEEE